MNKIVLFILSIMLFSSTIHLAQAQTNMRNYWQCTVSDQVNPAWVGEASSQQDAINNAWRLCKQNSNYSEQCEAARESCQQVINGRIYKPAWRCVAFDNNTGHFTGEKQTTRKGALASAMNRCTTISFVPKTCVVQLMTCKNV